MTNQRHLACRSLIAGLALALGARPAHAASSIFTGGVDIGSGQAYGCAAMNTSRTKTLTGVKVTMRRANGNETSDFNCAMVVPLGACGSGGFSNAATALGTVTCEATSDQGARLLRATLFNQATGNSSDAR